MTIFSNNRKAAAPTGVSQRRATILFAHGARDPAWIEPLRELKTEVEAMRPETCIVIAFLEMQQPDLVQALLGLAADGAMEIDVVPIFWAAGGHIRKDLPELIGRFRASHPGVHVRVLPVLSALPGMSRFVATAILSQVRK